MLDLFYLLLPVLELLLLSARDMVQRLEEGCFGKGRALVLGSTVNGFLE